MVVLSNVKIFQTGIADNKKLAVEKKTLDFYRKNFIDKPVLKYKTDGSCIIDEEDAIGHISGVGNIIGNNVYGDIVIYDNNNKGIFKNYGIRVKSCRREDRITIVNKYSLDFVVME